MIIYKNFLVDTYKGICIKLVIPCCQNWRNIMKNNTSKIFLSIVATLNFIVFSPFALSAEDEPNNKIVDESIDEVIVTGIRASLESALEAKRALSNLTEVINADDIGKLPDENIAEVLENIPGIQIDREGGIGSQVSVRGSSQNLSLIHI